jgi:minor extracellular serine protease Vpr
MRFLILLAIGTAAFAQERFAVVLEEAPVAVARTGRARVLESQNAVRRHLSRMKVREMGSTETLVNAVFIEATEEQAQEMRTMPGVKYVQRLRKYKRLDQPAADLARVQAAWNAAGGAENAGAGVKIGIIDSGIDHTHPALQDSTLTMPSGYPRCTGSACDFTSTKVIAARSFVDLLVYSFPDDTRPDDLSPRDPVGHGTAAAMLAAGRPLQGPGGRVTGVAPKAYLGNYKVFGSPGINDFSDDLTVIRAMEAALADGMDIVSLSLGQAAVWSPNDRGTICGNQGQTACDLQVEAVENATRAGMVVVASAGNDGDLGSEVPTRNSISSPGSAPSAITVGATTNSRILLQTVRVENGPANLRQIDARLGNGSQTLSPNPAPLTDVAAIDSTGLGCNTLGNGALANRVALILRGECSFLQKLTNAQRAGAAGVIVYQQNSNAVFVATGLEGTAIPLAMIGNRDGLALKQYLAATPEARVSFDASLRPVEATADDTAIFSSQGPSIGDSLIKPEIMAVGQDVYVATQNYDPNGDMFDVSRYRSVEGTSFSAPMVAGAVALVKQRYPTLAPAGLKSAVVNTADPRVMDFDYQGRPVEARAIAMGAGKLDAASAVRTTVLAVPATLSFGQVLPTSTFPVSRTLRLRNQGTGSANVRLTVVQRDTDSAARVTLTPASATLGAGQEATFTLRLEGTRPRAGIYEGIIRVEGGEAPLRIPYLYLVSDNIAFNAFPLGGDGFTRAPGRGLRLTAKFVDQFGAPVANLPVRFRAETGGSIDQATQTTDELGIAEARVVAGTALGQHRFSVEPVNGGDPRVVFAGQVVQEPALRSDGIVNAASGQVGRGLAPGSYISLFGASFTDQTRVFNTNYLPLSLAGVSVGFDVPGQTNRSFPGTISFVSPGQINVQVPWELAGQSQVQLKVSNGLYSSARLTIPLNEVSPAFFEYTDPGSGRQLIAALDQNFQLVTGAAPVARGSVVQLYANGLGPVDNQPATGQVAPSSPLATCRIAAQVTIGGQNATVLFAGLAPGFVGLYQINATVPAEAPTGIQPVVITMNGVASKTASLPVR